MIIPGINSMMDGPMYYTIDKLLLDDGKSLTLSEYSDKQPIGDELVAFMTGHMGNRTWKVGSTTQFGHHSFLLSIQPTIDVLRFWKAAKRNNWQVKTNCNGKLEVRDQSGTLFSPPEPLLKTIANDQTGQFKTLESFLKRKLKRFSS